MTEDDLLFVYGTLRRETGHAMHALLAEHVRLVGSSQLQGRLYNVDSYPGAILSDDPEAWVKGELYRLDNAGILARLDDYEECGPRFPEPHEYVRRPVSLTLENGDTVTAWAYLYNRDVAGLERIASGDYLAWQAGRS